MPKRVGKDPAYSSSEVPNKLSRKRFQSSPAFSMRADIRGKKRPSSLSSVVLETASWLEVVRLERDGGSSS